MRIIFMGTPDFAIPSLRILVENGYEVVGVITAPDRPAGRGRKLKPSPVKVYAESVGLKVLQPVKLKNPEFLAELEALKAELAVVVAFRMLPKVVWSLPSIGTFNLHGSLLPDYRGAAPINWVLINGEKETGLTTFFIDKKIDTGALLLQEKVQIPGEWTAGDLHDHMMEKGAELVLDTVKRIENGNEEAIPQDHSKFQNPAPKIFKEDCRINWDRPATEVYNFIRGLSPYPTAWTTLSGKTLKIFQVKPSTQAIGDSQPGTISRLSPEELLIACKDGFLAIHSLQLEGKKRLDTLIFLNGFKGELDCVE